MKSDSEDLLRGTGRTELPGIETRKEYDCGEGGTGKLSSLLDAAPLSSKSPREETSGWQLVLTAWSPGLRSRLKIRNNS